MNAFILLTSVWLAGADAAPAPHHGCGQHGCGYQAPCCYPYQGACCKVRPTLCQQLRDACNRPACDSCCECDSCGGCHLRDLLGKLFHRHGSCGSDCCGSDCCQPTCCQPTCCPTSCCDSCCDPCCDQGCGGHGCGGGLLSHLKGLFRGRGCNDCCCEVYCCDPCCGSNSKKPGAEQIGAPKEQPKKMPEGSEPPLKLGTSAPMHLAPVVIPSHNRIPF